MKHKNFEYFHSVKQRSLLWSVITLVYVCMHMVPLQPHYVNAQSANSRATNLQDNVSPLSFEGNKNWNVRLTPVGRLQQELHLSHALEHSVDKKTSDDIVTLGTFMAVYRRVLSDYYKPLDASVLLDRAIEYAREKNPDSSVVSRGVLLRSAIDGVMQQLDQYSVFLNREENIVFDEGIRGEYGGIGLYLTLVDNGMRIDKVLDNGPAKPAGLLKDDVIVSADNVRLIDVSPNQALAMLRGAPGTTVRLNILRDQRYIGFLIRRKLFTVNPVRSELYSNGIALVELSTFNDQAYQELVRAMEGIYRRRDIPLRGIIVDLRDNRGGGLDQSINVSDYFLPPGLVVYTQDRLNRRQYSFGRTIDQSRGVPVVVLINGKTASASEIVAGALKDRKRAIVVGATSFGKGVVQLKYSLHGNMGMKITTQEYFTPSGYSVDGGIRPDLIVEDDERKPGDEQLSAALKTIVRMVAEKESDSRVRY